MPAGEGGAASSPAGLYADCALLRARVELERAGVHAKALPRGGGPGREEAAAMPAAAPAHHLGAHHAVPRIAHQLDVRVLGGLVEARPAGAGLELGVRAE